MSDAQVYDALITTQRDLAIALDQLQRAKHLISYYEKRVRDLEAVNGKKETHERIEVEVISVKPYTEELDEPFFE